MELLHAIVNLTHARPVGAIVVAGDALAILLGIGAILVRRHRETSVSLAALGTASLAASLAMMVALSYAGMRQLAQDDARWDLSTFVALDTALLAQWIGGTGAAIAIPILAAARALVSRRARLGWVAAGVLGTIVAGFVRVDADETRYVVVGEDAQPLSRYRTIVEDRGPPATTVRWLVVSVGCAFGLGAVVAAVRRRRVTSGMRLVPGGVVLSTGLGLFVATRAMARDANDPVPFWDEEYFVFDDTNVPPATHPCAPGYAQAEIEIDGELRVDGKLVTDLRATLDAKRALYVALHGKATTVAIAASPATSLADVRTAGETARAAGFTRILAVTRRDRPAFHTATLGPIGRTPRLCYVDLETTSVETMFGP